MDIAGETRDANKTDPQDALGIKGVDVDDLAVAGNSEPVKVAMEAVQGPSEAQGFTKTKPLLDSNNQ
eukprot:6165960-Amphidinium_carterae.2